MRLVALTSALVLALFAGGLSSAPQAAAVSTAERWPIPVPQWFWTWARWYLHRSEFADEPFRSDATRPADAPERIPAWAWLRLEVLLGVAEPPPPEPPEPAPVVRTWPLPVPQWFWTWARWYLGRSEFADAGPQAPGVRPASAPRVIPEWAWRRFAALNGQEPPPLPTTTLRRGDSGPEVAALQRALNGARYVVGAADGIFGAKTRYGVIAFEKANGLHVDGLVAPDEYVRLLRERRPAPPVTGSDYVYVDLDRQVLFDVRGGRVTRVLPVSTGGGYTYTGLDGRRHVAVTPTGRYRVFRKVAGKDRSYLGTLYYPSYFSGGYAIHGSQSVPTTPVSHGCVRIPLWISQEFFRRTEIGTTVIVR